MATESEDLLQEAREAFGQCADAMADNRLRSAEDKKFARLGGEEQWPQEIIKQRRIDGRPYLTINRMPAFIRQVVNDGRQNRPQIKVRPVDSGADIKTAEVFSGLIRNIEISSNADVAYDTALENAVDGGFGYIRVGLEYAHDDTFDQDLVIERVANPFAVYGDPMSTAADSSDWNVAFVVGQMAEDVFAATFKGAEKVDWDTLGYGQLQAPWVSMERGKKVIQVADWWKREETTKKVVLLSNGSVVDRGVYELHKDIYDAELLTVLKEREVKSWKVTHRQITGAEILSETPWAGKWIPIVPVYGDDFSIEGERYLLSLIHHAKDPQRMHNFWRTTATEVASQAPKAPYIGEEGAFDQDERWETATTRWHPYLEYKKGSQPPQRQPLDFGPAAGALNEALMASDDMKAVMGLYDASLGARSNETSGRAIMARQREGDVSTFHFVDNLTRAIRHTGRILIDLIPKVYTGPRIVRILGQDGKPSMVALKSPEGATPDNMPEGIAGVFDLGAGKYDIAVEAGPSYTTRREEAAYQLTELIRAFPQGAPVLAPSLIKHMDLPDQDEIQARFEAMMNPAPEGPPPTDPAKMAEVRAKQETDQRKLDIESYKAETDRLEAAAKIVSPILAPIIQQTLMQLLGSPDILPGSGPPGPMPQGPQPTPQPAPAGFSLPGNPHQPTGVS